MLVAVVLDTGDARTLQVTRSTLLVGVACCSCRAPLELLTPCEDTDAVCLACGVTVGRVYPHARVDAAGEVHSTRRART